MVKKAGPPHAAGGSKSRRGRRQVFAAGATLLLAALTVGALPTAAHAAAEDPIAVGDGANSVTFSHDGTRAFVTNLGSHNVSVIDTATGSESARLYVGVAPGDSAVSRDGRFLYVANSGSGTIAVVDLLDNSDRPDIMVSAMPFAVEVSPDGGTLYVTRYATNSLIAIKLADGKWLFETHLGTEPSGAYALAISPDGSTLAATNRSTGTVAVLDAASGTLRTTIGVGRLPNSIAITPDGLHAVVANETDNSAQIVDLENGTASAPIAVGSSPIGVAITPDGTRAFISNTDSNAVAVLELASESVVASFAVGVAPRDVAISPDGSLLYVPSSSSSIGPGTVSVHRLPTVTRPTDQSVTVGHEATFTTTVRGNPDSIAWQLSTDDGASWQTIPDATDSSYTLFGAALPASGGLYRVIAHSESYGTTVSEAALLTVNLAAATPDTESEPEGAVGSTPSVLAESGAAPEGSLTMATGLLLAGALVFAARRRLRASGTR